MRYQIDTIPVWDAYRASGSCPLCRVQKQAESLLVDRFLGGSVMEPDTRIRVNQKGFCARHHDLLYQKQNRLGHALMMQSHMAERRKQVEALFDAPKGGGFSLFKKDIPQAPAPASCILCDALDDMLRRTVYSLLHLYQKDKEFQALFVSSPAPCLHHLPLMIQMGREHLPGSVLPHFLDALKQAVLRDFDKNKADLDWFILKFDYRNQQALWKDAKDAMERCVNYLSGHTLGALAPKKDDAHER